MKTEMLEQPVGQLVAEKPARSQVFERWGIDYCCGGKKPLAEVCQTKKLDREAIVRDLEASDAVPTPDETDWNQQSLTKLCDHIVAAHHDYLREALPRLSVLIGKVAERHGAKDRRLVSLRALFQSFSAEMLAHMGKEEQILFPSIRLLEAGGSATRVLGPIEVMLAEHDHAGADLEEMKSLTDGFAPNPEACNTWRAMLQGLSDLNADTHVHVHKENNILFPRAVKAAQAAG